MQSKDPSFSRKSSEQKLTQLASNIGGLSHAEAAQQLLELSNEFRYYSMEAEITAPFEKAAEDLKTKLKAKLQALQEKAATNSVPAIEKPAEEKPLQEDMFTSIQAGDTKNLNDRLAGNVLKFGLNDRIGYVNELFGGSQEDFNRVVSQLNTIGNLGEAMEFIETHVSSEYGWDQKEETAARFVAAVEQKFS